MTRDIRRANAKVVGIAVAAVVAMVGFAFAQVPLYYMMSEAFGVNGQTRMLEAGELAKVKPDLSRTVKVEFYAIVDGKLPWVLRPEMPSMLVHPGEVHEVTLTATNLSGFAIAAQAVASVAPDQAAMYVRKSADFVRERPYLQSGKSESLPVRFMVERNLPQDIHTVTLGYTFFRATADGPDSFLSDQRQRPAIGERDHEQDRRES